MNGFKGKARGTQRSKEVLCVAQFQANLSEFLAQISTYMLTLVLYNP